MSTSALTVTSQSCKYLRNSRQRPGTATACLSRHRGLMFPAPLPRAETDCIRYQAAICWFPTNTDGKERVTFAEAPFTFYFLLFGGPSPRRDHGKPEHGSAEPFSLGTRQWTSASEFQKELLSEQTGRFNSSEGQQKSSAAQRIQKTNQSRAGFTALTVEFPGRGRGAWGTGGKTDNCFALEFSSASQAVLGNGTTSRTRTGVPGWNRECALPSRSCVPFHPGHSLGFRPSSWTCTGQRSGHQPWMETMHWKYGPSELTFAVGIKYSLNFRDLV